MDLRYKLYPYPVLTKYTDDYTDSKFDVEMINTLDGKYVKLNFSAQLENAGLTKLLEKNDIHFLYHLECSQTGFRTDITTSKHELIHLIENNKLRGRLQICTFIVAINDLPKFKNENFHEDYRGFTFAIEKGCIIGVGDQFNVDIEEDPFELENTPSIFSIIKNLDPEAQGMLVDMGQSKIIIKIPEKSFYSLDSIKHIPQIQPTINSLTIIPALLYVLEEVSKRPIDERYDDSQYGWYRAINKALKQKFDCEFETEAFSNLNMIEVAQKLINSPLDDALAAMFSDFRSSDSYEEEDE